MSERVIDVRDLRNTDGDVEATVCSDPRDRGGMGGVAGLVLAARFFSWEPRK